jgi:hypothetical protein
MDIVRAKFTDPASDNYSLTSDSPAVDSGISLSALGIMTDYVGVSRPQGPAFDIGAFELDKTG